jgi:predicted nucleic acid-binding protein
LADLKKIYWDSCVWLRLINGESKSGRCEYLIECAKRGEVEIWTSSLTLAEVYKATCGTDKIALDAGHDIAFENYIEQDFVQEVQLDHDIGVLARRLCRAHEQLKKPNDGIHLATAVLWNLDEFHTFDRDDLLRLNGSVKKQNGSNILICEPPEPPKPKVAELPKLPLFPDA